MLTEIASIIGIVSGVAGIFISYQVFKAMKTMPQTLMDSTVTPIVEDLKSVFAPTMKKAFGQLSEKGVEAREVKRVEKMVAKDMKDFAMQQNPEVALVLSALRGETMEALEENPQIAMQLIGKYRPLLEQFLPQLKEGQAAQKQLRYDL
jgi:hypothetical protein